MRTQSQKERIWSASKHTHRQKKLQELNPHQAPLASLQVLHIRALERALPEMPNLALVKEHIRLLVAVLVTVLAVPVLPIVEESKVVLGLFFGRIAGLASDGEVKAADGFDRPVLLGRVLDHVFLAPVAD